MTESSYMTQVPSEEVLFHARIELPYHATKKNGKSAFNGYVVMSSRSRQAEKYLVLKLLQIKNLKRITEPLRCDMHCVLFFEFSDYYCKPKRKSDLPQRRKNLPDLSNLLELPADCMQPSKPNKQRAGIIEDDTLICSFDGSRRLPSKDDKNWLEIFIYKFNEQTGQQEPQLEFQK